MDHSFNKFLAGYNSCVVQQALTDEEIQGLRSAYSELYRQLGNEYTQPYATGIIYAYATNRAITQARIQKDWCLIQA